MKTLFNTALADVARDQMFRHESPRGSNRGPLLADVFAADDYEPIGGDFGYPWCAAFVDFCVAEWIRRGGEMDASLPKTAAAFGLLDWGRKWAPATLVFSQNNPNFGPAKLWPQKGDIVVYTFRHCGIVSQCNPGQTHFLAIEGNTDTDGSREGWEVAEKARTFGLVQRWIRIMPPKGTFPAAAALPRAA